MISMNFWVFFALVLGSCMFGYFMGYYSPGRGPR